jgi:hypothetical protein
LLNELARLACLFFIVRYDQPDGYIGVDAEHLAGAGAPYGPLRRA